ncbi:MAG: ADP-ribosylation/Crystallin J1 [Chloroflexi bacterium OLB15]|nr:MAG: ADP-ribosylation/Crystallin J1 [Chloroflexi bacterium OLB15]
MIGAIIGDIVGSVYEWDNIKTKDFTLFHSGCHFTDDTVMTVAISEALKKGGRPDDFVDEIKKWGRLYPDAGYGGHFRRWLFSNDRDPYNSWGNGSAMRVSPCGWVVPLQQFIREGFEDVRDYARRSAEVTHSHPEGIKGAQAVALAIFFMRHGAARNDLDTYKGYLKRDLTEWFDYDLDRRLDDIRPTYSFDVSCQGSVPEAIIAFLESTDFEDAIRNAVSLGGDSDTIAAITGSIAEAAYGVPDDLRNKALTFLDDRLQSALSYAGA